MKNSYISSKPTHDLAQAEQLIKAYSKSAFSSIYISGYLDESCPEIEEDYRPGDLKCCCYFCDNSAIFFDSSNFGYCILHQS